MVTMWFQLILLLAGLGCKALSCPANCKCAAGNSTCLSCTDGFKGVDCKEPCRNTCISCLSEYGCIKCKPGYESHCNRTCPENCTRCSSPQNCNTCKTGHFGKMCEHKCPENCQNGSCHKNSGYCNNACINRYHGPRCDLTCRKHCLTCSHYWYCDKCESGFYGYNCQNRCGQCKGGATCAKTNGHCNDGCSDGYFDFTCSKKCKAECKTCHQFDYACKSCIDGKYGRFQFYQCHRDCPEHCANKACYPDTGNCLACVDGYTGDKCDCPEPCQYCSSPGVCTSCKAGFSDAAKQCKCRRNPCTNDTCEACTNSTWYLDKYSGSCCECSSTCKNRTCISEKRCLQGCIDGYYGGTCDMLCRIQDQNCVECKSIDGHYSGCIKCKVGFYPGGANNTCFSCHGTCLYGSCSSNNGHCTEGCIDSLWGAKCDKECSKACLKCDRWSGECLKCHIGRYSSTDCSKTCSKTCKVTQGQLVCSINDGFCTHGCSTETVYGPQCRHLCNDGCLQNKCDRETGRCLVGCGDNFYGDNCNTTCNHGCIDVSSGRRCSLDNGSCIAGCRAGFFGDRCDVKCSKYCQNDNCSRLEGICVSGCIPGFYGDRCDIKCSKHCMDDACSQSSGVCEFGCIAGLYGDRCDNRCSMYCMNDICSRPKGVCELGCIAGYSGDTCFEYMASSASQSDTYITWSMIGPVSGAGATLIIVISMVACICRKRRRAVKGEQVPMRCPLEGISSQGGNRVPGYNNVTLYDFLDDEPMDENNHPTETPKPTANRIVPVTGGNRSRRAVKEEQEDIPLQILCHPAEENRASDYDSVSIYDALREGSEIEHEEYSTVTPETGAPRTVIPGTGAPRNVIPETGAPRNVTPDIGASRNVIPKLGVNRAVSLEPETSHTFTPEPGTSRTPNPESRTSHIYCNVKPGKQSQGNTRTKNHLYCNTRTNYQPYCNARIAKGDRK